MGELYASKDTRPHSIVNADNRLMTSALRQRFVEVLAPRVSPMQRVFLRGRSLLHNVIEVDHEAMRISLQG